MMMIAESPQARPAEGAPAVGLPDDGRVRLFLALWPGRETRAHLRAARDAWVWTPQARRVTTQHLHLTLHFLGDRPRGELPALIAALRVPVVPFLLTLDRFTLWPPGIAVWEASQTPPGLLALHHRLGEVLSRARVPLERRPYRPHVTLARKAKGSAIPADCTALHWKVRGFALVASLAGPPRRYEVLARIP